MALLTEILMKVLVLVVFIMMKYYWGETYPAAIQLLAGYVGGWLTKP